MEERADEQAHWNGRGGQSWVELQDVLDELYGPLERQLVDAVAERGDVGRVLDVGCGTGATTVALARRLGPSGACTGVDISESMVAAARQRAEREGVAARFVVADAQRHHFDPGGFDAVASRFGVMFFDDAVEAFTNLRGATRPGGELRLIVWRSAEDNPFMTTAEHAAAPLVSLPPREPDAPGQFAFADQRRVRSVLEQSGWGGVGLEPIDVVCTMPEHELLGYSTRLGALGRALADADDSTRDRIAQAVRPAFDPYVDGSEVRFVAACWMVAGRA